MCRNLYFLRSQSQGIHVDDVARKHAPRRNLIASIWISERGVAGVRGNFESQEGGAWAQVSVQYVADAVPVGIVRVENVSSSLHERLEGQVGHCVDPRGIDYLNLGRANDE